MRERIVGTGGGVGWGGVGEGEGEGGAADLGAWRGGWWRWRSFLPSCLDVLAGVEQCLLQYLLRSGAPFRCRGVAGCRNHVGHCNGDQTGASPHASSLARTTSRSFFHLSSSMRVGWVSGSHSAKNGKRIVSPSSLRGSASPGALDFFFWGLGT